MDTVIRKVDLITGFILVLFLGVCFHFHQKGAIGPWHQTAMSLWQKEEWGKLQALGDNLFRVQKEDVESYFFALLASKEAQNESKLKLFAERLLSTRVLNWKIEIQSAALYQPDTLRKRIAMYRTRIIYGVLFLLGLLLVVSATRKKLYHWMPIALCAVGFVVLIL